MALQNKDYTLGDFYGDWIKTKRNLQKLDHPLAVSILTHMNERENQIMNSKLMLASVYLDPRFNMLLNNNQQQTAQNFLLELWQRLNEMCPMDTIADINSDEVDDFASFLSNQAQQNETTPEQINIAKKIESFLNRPSIHYKSNIIGYWRKIKVEEPELFRLVTVLFTVAVTQVDVERAFSSLKFIFNNYRARMNTEILSILLILRANHDLFPKTYDFYIDD